MIHEAATTAEVGRYLPAHAFGRVEVVLQVVLVVLLDVRRQAVVLAVDHDAHEVRFRSDRMLAADMAEQHLAHHARVLIRVQQVERLVAVEALLVVNRVDRDVERLLDIAERGVPATADAYVLVRLPVDGHRRGDLDVRTVERLDLLGPIVALELEEDRAQDAFVVETGFGVHRGRGRVEGRQFGRRRRLTTVSATLSPTRSTSTTAATSTFGLTFGHLHAGQITFFAIQPAIAVGVEVLDEFDGLVVRATTSRSAWTASTETTGRRSVLGESEGCGRGDRDEAQRQVGGLHDDSWSWFRGGTANTLAQPSALERTMNPQSSCVVILLPPVDR